MDTLRSYNKGVWVVAMAVVLAGALAFLTLDHRAADLAECGNAARIVANRSYARSDPAAFLQVRDQAYGVCLADPAAFRRLLR